jgi:hypothetical protein
MVNTHTPLVCFEKFLSRHFGKIVRLFLFCTVFGCSDLAALAIFANGWHWKRCRRALASSRPLLISVCCRWRRGKVRESQSSPNGTKHTNVWMRSSNLDVSRALVDDKVGKSLERIEDRMNQDHAKEGLSIANLLNYPSCGGPNMGKVKHAQIPDCLILHFDCPPIVLPINGPSSIPVPEHHVRTPARVGLADCDFSWWATGKKLVVLFFFGGKIQLTTSLLRCCVYSTATARMSTRKGRGSLAHARSDTSLGATVPKS